MRRLGDKHSEVRRNGLEQSEPVYDPLLAVYLPDSEGGRIERRRIGGSRRDCKPHGRRESPREWWGFG